VEIIIAKVTGIRKARKNSVGGNPLFISSRSALGKIANREMLKITIIVLTGMVTNCSGKKGSEKIKRIVRS
jgi:hypothetical protein